MNKQKTKLAKKITNCRIGVDIGGTFTDIIIATPTTTRIHKLLSNNLAGEQALIQALDFLNIAITPQQFLHSTTVVTNMLLEHKGARTGFITSQGMRDILHIARHKRPLNYAIRQTILWQHFPPVPRQWRLTVPERIDKDGKIITPLDTLALKSAVKTLLAAGIESIAVGFLHSYNHPKHEELAKKIIGNLVPHIQVTLSSEVSPRFREYERFMTTALNARVKPAVNNYLKKITQKMHNKWPQLSLTLMTSNGGLEEVTPAGDIQNTPIRLAMSGPAAAGNAFVQIAKKLKTPNCVGLDVGGTSADITVIKNSKLHEAPLEHRSVAGYPLQIPMLDLHTIGAGGGSLIYMDEFGELHVGPKSAGSNPGPACYGLGGQLPTITDAAVVVGRLPIGIKLAGELPLQHELSIRAFCTTFNLGTTENEQKKARKIAYDALMLAEASIAFAIREQTVERGLDPKQMSLIAAGGAGGILACGIADIVELREVIVPPKPGLLAAWGLLVSPLQKESTLTILKNLSNLKDSDVQKILTKVRKKLANKNSQDIHYIAALRYLGQGFEVELELGNNIDSVAKLCQAFCAAHKKEYGFVLNDVDVEWIEVRARQINPPTKPDIFPLNKNKKTPAQEHRTKIWHYEKKTSEVSHISAQLVQRDELPKNYHKRGPLIVSEVSSTTYVPPGWQLKVDAYGFMRITRAERDHNASKK